MKLNEKKKKDLKIIKDAMNDLEFVIAAGIYGSWLYHPESSDIDIAVLIASQDGVVEPNHYAELNEYRHGLSDLLHQDLDFIPHTEDELTDLRSPLWYPKSNPSLCYLYPLKSQIDVRPISMVKHHWLSQDVAAFLIHENRTVCRRQLTRHVDGEAGRIFVSKMLHGTANALTYYACRARSGYVCTPSDLNDCLLKFDFYFGLDTSLAWDFLLGCKKSFDFDKARRLMCWYEHLLGNVLYGRPTTSEYARCCREIRSIDVQYPSLAMAA